MAAPIYTIAGKQVDIGYRGAPLDEAALLPGISGYLPIRNGDELDYHWRECVASILPVCDEVVVCDCDSNDGTTEAILKLAADNPKIRRINWPFTNPDGDYYWHDKWVNFARMHLRHKMALYMDADHVIGPESYVPIKYWAAQDACRWFNYIFFSGDPQHTEPWGSEMSCQLSPTKFWWPSQNDVPDGETNIRLIAVGPTPEMNVYSYSTLRKREAFVTKSERYYGYIEGGGNSPFKEALARIKDTERPAKDYYANPVIRPFTGQHPPAIHQWLLDRGWKL